MTEGSDVAGSSRDTVRCATSPPHDGSATNHSALWWCTSSAVGGRLARSFAWIAVSGSAHLGSQKRETQVRQPSSDDLNRGRENSRGVIEPARAYIVCSTQRSGSTYLCQLLASTGVAGVPHEYFEARAETGSPPHPGYFLAGLPRTGAGIRDDPSPTDAPDYSDLSAVDGWQAHLERTFRLGTTDNGVFGAKLMWNQLSDLEQHAAAVPQFAGATGSELLERVLGRPVYVWVRRRDKVRQAISMWRALQTRTWRLENPAARHETPQLSYSFAGIDHLRRRLSGDDDAWGRFFLGSLIEPLEFVLRDRHRARPDRRRRARARVLWD